jgi:hypothetical protein
LQKDHAQHEGCDEGVDLTKRELPEEALGQDEGREDREGPCLRRVRPGELVREPEDYQDRGKDDEEPDGFGGIGGEQRHRNIEEGGERRILELVMAVLGAIEGFSGMKPLPGLVVHLEIDHSSPYSREGEGRA